MTTFMTAQLLLL